MKSSAIPIKAPRRVIGADVAKETVVLCDSLTMRTTSVANTCEALTAALAPFGPDDLLVCEVTGGYELATLEAALGLGLPAHRADAARVKNFIRSHGGIAKTDRIDARWLVRYGQERGPGLVRWRARNIDRDALAALVRHRGHLVDQRVKARNRKDAPGAGELAPFLEAEIAFLGRQIEDLDQAIADKISRIDHLADDEKTLRAVAGFGPVVARSLLAFMPELGTLTRRQAASLAAQAPHPLQSGTSVNFSRTRGGRTQLRPILFMAALTAMRSNPQMKAFATRLLADGKAKRLVLGAIARKLVVLANALLRAKHTAPQLT
jgi:transposase